MLQRTPRDALQEHQEHQEQESGFRRLIRTFNQEDQEQESGFRRLIRTFNPEVPGYVFWPVMFGVAVIFQQTVLRGF
jgi:hypothetical protein